jgi:hypothetical protein
VQFDNGVLEPVRVEDFFVLASRMEVFMVLIKVQYDAYNRQFTPLDGQLLKLLEDGETYMLIVDVSVEDLKSAGTANEGSVQEGPVLEAVSNSAG